MAGKFKKYCLALDLKDEKEKIDAYLKYNENVWPEINKSLKDSGIISAEIFHTGNRLFMILEVDKSFTFNKKAKLDGSNPKVVEWETLMWKFQQSIPNSKPGVKWVLMDKIYDLNMSEV